jgi:hypothetical protein
MQKCNWNFFPTHPASFHSQIQLALNSRFPNEWMGIVDFGLQKVQTSHHLVLFYVSIYGKHCQCKGGLQHLQDRNAATLSSNIGHALWQLDTNRLLCGRLQNNWHSHWGLPTENKTKSKFLNMPKFHIITIYHDSWNPQEHKLSSINHVARRLHTQYLQKQKYLKERPSITSYIITNIITYVSPKIQNDPFPSNKTQKKMQQTKKQMGYI